MWGPVNETRVLLASAARTASVNTASQTNEYWRGCHVVINVTAAVDTPTVVFTVQGYDNVGDGWYDLLSSANVTGTGRTILKVYPGTEVKANEDVSDILPPVWRVKAVHSDSDSITYSVIAHLVV